MSEQLNTLATEDAGRKQCQTCSSFCFFRPNFVTFRCRIRRVLVSDGVLETAVSTRGSLETSSLMFLLDSRHFSTEKYESWQNATNPNITSHCFIRPD